MRPAYDVDGSVRRDRWPCVDARPLRSADLRCGRSGRSWRPRQSFAGKLTGAGCSRSGGCSRNQPSIGHRRRGASGRDFDQPRAQDIRAEPGVGHAGVDQFHYVVENVSACIGGQRAGDKSVLPIDRKQRSERINLCDGFPSCLIDLPQRSTRARRINRTIRQHGMKHRLPTAQSLSVRLGLPVGRELPNLHRFAALPVVAGDVPYLLIPCTRSDIGPRLHLDVEIIPIDQWRRVVGQQVASGRGLFLSYKRVIDDVRKLRGQSLRGDRNFASVLRRVSPLRPEGIIRSRGRRRWCPSTRSGAATSDEGERRKQKN